MSRIPLAMLTYTDLQAKPALINRRESTKSSDETVVKSMSSGARLPRSKLGSVILGCISLSFLVRKMRIRVPYLMGLLGGLNEAIHIKCL